MKQLERKKLMTYRWWRVDDEKAAIVPEHVEALEESAEERIGEMMGEGYVSGELHANIRMLDNDPEDGVDYTGRWEVIDKS